MRPESILPGSLHHVLKCSPSRRGTVTVNKTGHPLAVIYVCKILMGIEEIEFSPSIQQPRENATLRLRAGVAKKPHISLLFSKISLYWLPTRTEWNLSLQQP
jgi:hypothetical protein